MDADTLKLRAAYIRRLADALLFGNLVLFNTASAEEQDEARQLLANLGIKIQEENSGS